MEDVEKGRRNVIGLEAKGTQDKYMRKKCIRKQVGTCIELHGLQTKAFRDEHTTTEPVVGSSKS